MLGTLQHTVYFKDRILHCLIFIFFFVLVSIGGDFTNMELAISLENNSYPSLANMDNSIDQQQANGAQVGSGVTTTVMDLPVTLLERNDESAFPRCIHQRALNHSNSINGMKEKSSPAETLSVSTTVGTVGNSQVQAAKVLTIKNLNNENRQINISSNFDNNNQANHSNNSNNNTSQSSTITSLILLQPLNKTHNPPNSGTSAIGRNDCYISTTSTTVLPSFSQHYSEGKFPSSFLPL